MTATMLFLSAAVLCLAGSLLASTKLRPLLRRAR
jgi:hypothetical protein